MAICQLVKKAAILAMGFALLRSSTVEGFRTLVWQANGLPDQIHVVRGGLACFESPT